MEIAKPTLDQIFEKEISFIVPAYQRHYVWDEKEQWLPLWEDILSKYNDRLNDKATYNHYIGSYVLVQKKKTTSQMVNKAIVIDGQQRLTTISLLLLAIRDLARSSKIEIDEKNLHEQIEERFLISKWAKDEDRIKLRPVKSDRDALVKLFGDEEDYEANSNLTLNYRYFYDIVQKEEVKAEELFAAIAKLEG